MKQQQQNKAEPHTQNKKPEKALVVPGVAGLKPGTLAARRYLGGVLGPGPTRPEKDFAGVSVT